MVATSLIIAGTAAEAIGLLMFLPVLQVFVSGTSLVTKVPSIFGGLLAGVGRTGQIIAVCFVIASLLVIRSCVLVARDTAIVSLQHGYVDAIKTRLLRKMAGAPWHSVMTIDRGRLIKALGSDILQITTSAHQSVQGMVNAIMVLAYLAFAVALAPKLALISVIVLASVGFSASATLSRSRAIGESTSRYDLVMAGSAMRFLAGLKLATAQGLQDTFIDRYTDASRKGVAHHIAFARLMSISRNKAVAIVGLGGGALFVTAALLSDVPPARLLAVVVLLLRAGVPAAAVQQGIQQFANALPKFEEVHGLEEMLAHQARADLAVPSPTRLAQGKIELQAVDFAYESVRGNRASAALRDVSVSIEPGELVAISGPSGSGKSTFLDVIAGLAKPSSGRVLVGGRPLRGSVLAQHLTLSYLAADPVLFADTVRENMLWTWPAATDEQIWAALRTVGARELVESLPEGLDHRVSEQGNDFSAGQRQQLALARAILRKPAILLLDEATCSLDMEREARLLESLSRLEPRPTVLLISHRAETLALADRVLVFADGSLIDDRALASTGVKEGWRLASAETMRAVN